MASVNASPEYYAAERKYGDAKTPEDKIRALEEMLRLAPKHKASHSLLAEIRFKIARLKKEIQLEVIKAKQRKSGASEYVKKQGVQSALLGLPNAGKTALFNALTGRSVPAENYPFTTIDPSVGTVGVPDARLSQLAELSRSRKTVPAIVSFVDIAGLVTGAHKGEGLGNQFLSHIREVDAIVEVVRVFYDDKVIHVGGGISPAADIEAIELELALADLATVERRASALTGYVRKGPPAALAETRVLSELKGALEGGKRASSVLVDRKEEPFVKSLSLLTAKPVLYAFNIKIGGRNMNETEPEKFRELCDEIRSRGDRYSIVDAGLEFGLESLSIEERHEFRRGLPEGYGGLDVLIKESHALLRLITFFTTGEDETRGWTVRRGALAPEAGAAIHTDFCERFIRAEVVAASDLIALGSMAKAREEGRVRTEGKDYVVKDGDVIEFKI